MIFLVKIYLFVMIFFYKNFDELKLDKKNNNLDYKINNKNYKKLNILSCILSCLWHYITFKDINTDFIKNLDDNIKFKIIEYLKNINNFNNQIRSIKYIYKIICVNIFDEKISVLNFMSKDILMIISGYTKEPLIEACYSIFPSFTNHWEFTVTNNINLNLTRIKIICTGSIYSLHKKI